MRCLLCNLETPGLQALVVGQPALGLVHQHCLRERSLQLQRAEPQLYARPRPSSAPPILHFRPIIPVAAAAAAGKVPAQGALALPTDFGGAVADTPAGAGVPRYPPGEGIADTPAGVPVYPPGEGIADTPNTYAAGAAAAAPAMIEVKNIEWRYQYDNANRQVIKRRVHPAILYSILYGHLSDGEIKQIIAFVEQLQARKEKPYIKRETETTVINLARDLKQYLTLIRPDPNFAHWDSPYSSYCALKEVIQQIRDPALMLIAKKLTYNPEADERYIEKVSYEEHFGFKVKRVIAAGLGAKGYETAIVESAVKRDQEYPIVIAVKGPNECGQLGIGRTHPEVPRAKLKVDLRDYLKTYDITLYTKKNPHLFVTASPSLLYCLNDGHEIIVFVVGSAHTFVITSKDGQYHYWGVGADYSGQLTGNCIGQHILDAWTYLNNNEQFDRGQIAKITPLIARGYFFAQASAQGAGTQLVLRCRDPSKPEQRLVLGCPFTCSAKDFRLASVPQ